MASTVLPNGIIIPEKFSRDWYADLYHNWQELDNLLGGGTPKDGTLTIQKNGDTVGTFSANQATDETINIEVPTVNDATLTIQQNGTTVDTFTANSSTDKTVDITVPTKTSDLTNDSGFITSDDTKIPLAGSNQISGDLIPSTDGTVNLGGTSYQWNNAYIKSLTINGVACGDILTHNASEFVPRSGGQVFSGTLFTRSDTNSSINFRSGPYYADGASIQLKGKDQTDASGGRAYITAHNGTRNTGLVIWPTGEVILDNALVLKTNADNTCSCGASDRRWTEVYAATGTINTSDSRFKNSVKDIDNTLLDAWENIEPKQYKFNDATEKKGEKARFHTGYLAQDIQAECEKQGINASDYGLFCYDEWEEQEEISEEIETEKDGKIVKEKHIIQPKREKGNSYALRYEEALVVECKYLRRCIARLTARIEELEKGNNSK